MDFHGAHAHTHVVIILSPTRGWRIRALDYTSRRFDDCEHDRRRRHAPSSTRRGHRSFRAVFASPSQQQSKRWLRFAYQFSLDMSRAAAYSAMRASFSLTMMFIDDAVGAPRLRRHFL